MEQLELRAKHREVIGKQVKALRREGLIPGILYGSGVDPIPLLFESHDIEIAAREAGTSTLVQLYVEGKQKPFTAIFRDSQRDPIKHDLIHVDLLALNLEETVRVAIPLILTGEAAAVQEEGGVLLQQLNEVEVEGLPMALVSSIEVDVSDITEVGQTITVADIPVPEGITILTPMTETVAQVSAVIEEAILEEALEPVPEIMGEVEVIGKGKEEEGEEMLEEGEEEEEA